MTTQNFSLPDHEGKVHSISFSDLPAGSVLQRSEASRFNTAALWFGSSSGSATPYTLRVVDLQTGRTLGGRTFDSTAFLLPSRDIDTTFHVGQLSGSGSSAVMTVQSFDYGLNASSMTLATPLASASFGAGALSNFVYWNAWQYIPPQNAGGNAYMLLGGSIGNVYGNYLYKSVPPAQGSNAPASLVMVDPPPDISASAWREIIFDGTQLWMRSGSGWGTPDFQESHWTLSAGGAWTPVTIAYPDDAYWDRYQLFTGFRSVFRDGMNALDFRDLPGISASEEAGS